MIKSEIQVPTETQTYTQLLTSVLMENQVYLFFGCLMFWQHASDPIIGQTPSISQSALPHGTVKILSTKAEGTLTLYTEKQTLLNTLTQRIPVCLFHLDLFV